MNAALISVQDIFEKDINLRMNKYKRKRKELLGKNKSIVDFANAHNYLNLLLLIEQILYLI